ncbi:hypothetical protein ES705_10983 [subsurface metagenome]
MKAIRIVPLAEEHLNQTSQLHLREMPKDLASKMGIRIVRNVFHQGMLVYPQSIGLVALDGNHVVGFGFAQIDFAGFSRHQRKRFLVYYPAVSLALLKKPWLFFETLSALKYLKLETAFTNLGPLVVEGKYRSLEFSKQNKNSIASMLTSTLFEQIKEKNPNLKVLTMIRPDNLPSIAAVSVGARSQGFSLFKKSRIWFGSDERIVFKYSL